MRCFWELSFIPGWICVAFWFHSVFFLITRLLSRMFLQQSMPCITPHSSNQISACRTQLTQGPAHSRGLRPRMQLQDWEGPQLWAPKSMNQAGTQCLQGNAVETSLSSLGFICSVIPHPFFPYLIFYIKSWRFLSASVWPPNPINIRIFFPHLQNKQTIRRPASPQLFLTF